MGQVRPPKEGERYLALLKVEQVNFEEPEKTKHRIAFDNLRPRYPDERIRLERKNGDLSHAGGGPALARSARASAA